MLHQQMSLSELDPKGSQLAKTLAYLCERKGKKDTLEKVLTEKGIYSLVALFHKSTSVFRCRHFRPKCQKALGNCLEEL